MGVRKERERKNKTVLEKGGEGGKELIGMRRENKRKEREMIREKNRRVRIKRRAKKQEKWNNR